MYKNLTINSLDSRSKWKATSLFETMAQGGTSGVYGAYFDMDAEGGKYLVIVQNASESNNKKVVLKAGNSMFAQASDIEVTLDAGDSAFLQPESGVSKIVAPTAAYASDIPSTTSPMGKVFLTADFAAKIVVFKEV